MFEKKMGFVNEVKKVLGLGCCVIQKYFGTDMESAQKYFEDCCEKYDEEHYDVHIEENQAYERYQVIVERRGA